MRAGQRSGLALGLLWAAVSVAVFGSQAGLPNPAGQRGRPPSIRKTRPEIAQRGQYPREEWFVRDVYARLMRYDYAARQVARVETGVVAEPEAYLAVSLRNLRTQDAGSGVPAAPLGATAAGPFLSLRRSTLCHEGDPCHASYEVAWGNSAVAVGEARTFAGLVMRVTTYDVTLSLGAQSRQYTAQVRYHEAGDGVSVEPEVVDPVMPGLQQVADDDAPMAVASWDRYVKTRRYAAVVKRITDLRRAGKRAVPDRAPIGSLPGDDVTPQQEAMVMMAVGEPCESSGLDPCNQCAAKQATSKTGVLSYDPSELPGQTVRPHFTYAFHKWTTAMAGKVTLTRGSGGHVQVRVDVEDVGVYGQADYGDQIWIYPMTVAAGPEVIRGIFLHEIGHSLGFKASPSGSPCGWNSTVMWDSYDGSHPPTGPLHMLLEFSAIDRCTIQHYGETERMWR